VKANAAKTRLQDLVKYISYSCDEKGKKESANLSHNWYTIPRLREVVNQANTMYLSTDHRP
jgi:hypothetical protein